LLRVAASSLFAEHAAPGLIKLFADRADDLDVELSVRNPDQFNTVLLNRAADVAIGPHPGNLDESVLCRSFMNYQMVLVVGPAHALAKGRVGPHQLREQTWLLGPSAATAIGAVPRMLHRLNVPEHRQQIFQSHAAALEEAKHNKGVALALSFVVAQDIAEGHLVQLDGPAFKADNVWCTLVLSGNGRPSPAAEFTRFATTPRAIQAMLRGAGVSIGHFRPSIHVTLWS
jgi:DNA-binding transcriptional LysR family regulator